MIWDCSFLILIEKVKKQKSPDINSELLYDIYIVLISRHKDTKYIPKK
jgi:hypothetical protein